MNNDFNKFTLKKWSEVKSLTQKQNGQTFSSGNNNKWQIWIVNWS